MASYAACSVGRAVRVAAATPHRLGRGEEADCLCIAPSICGTDAEHLERIHHTSLAPHRLGEGERLVEMGLGILDPTGALLDPSKADQRRQAISRPALGVVTARISSSCSRGLAVSTEGDQRVGAHQGEKREKWVGSASEQRHPTLGAGDRNAGSPSAIARTATPCIVQMSLNGPRSTAHLLDLVGASARRAELPCATATTISIQRAMLSVM